MARKKSKKSSKTSSPKKRSFKTRENINIERALIDNFIALQKVMTNLSVKFDNLSDNISKLLNLFEISAKALAEKEISLDKDKKDNKKILEQLDNLLDQNKVIAKGITLIHEGNSGEMEEIEEIPPESINMPPIPSPMPQRQIIPQQVPRQMMQRMSIQPIQQPVPESGLNLQGYQRSISSGDKHIDS